MKKRIFNQGAGPGLKALILVILTIVIIVCGQKIQSLRIVRTSLNSYVTYPIEWLVDAPVRLVRWFSASMVSEQRLVRENAKLRANALLLKAKLQKLLALQKENTQLRELLQSSPEVSGRVQVARLLAVDLDPNLQQIVVDAGTNHRAYIGQPVLDAYGVMGQIISTTKYTSNILLVSDKRSAVPVQDYRNSERAVAVGEGVSGRLTLQDVPEMGDIKVGDLFVTSGLGLRYPVGYPVGVVSNIAKNPITGLKTITLFPTAHFDQTEQVLLAWPTKSKLFHVVQQQLQHKTPYSRDQSS